MLTLRPLGSEAQPQSPRGIQRTAVFAAAAEGYKSAREKLSWDVPKGRILVSDHIPSKIWRMRYASFVEGASSGQRSADLANCSSLIMSSAYCFMLKEIPVRTWGLRDDLEL